MSERYSIDLGSIINEFSMKTVYLPPEGEKRLVYRAEVNRPGLPLHGYYDHFEPGRVQIFGKLEHGYLCQMPPEKRDASLREFFSRHPVAVVVTSSLFIFDEMVRYAKEYAVPILSTEKLTSEFMAALIASLNVSLAPRITRHGVFVEVYGEGMLIVGDSGVGKSEAAIELVKRGHRLIADDAVQIKKVSDRTLVGSAPDIIRNYVELRGIGIIDVSRLFGMGAVKATEKIDLVINLEPWVNGKMYDRLGLDQEYTDIMGIRIPTTTIPVKPGRNLAIILEIAAMNNRQKRMGYNTAEEFNQRLMEQMKAEQAREALKKQSENND